MQPFISKALSEQNKRKRKKNGEFFLFKKTHLDKSKRFVIEMNNKEKEKKENEKRKRKKKKKSDSAFFFLLPSAIFFFFFQSESFRGVS